MKHIRKFNENFGGQELDFETFKMIISSDIEDEFEFENIYYYDVEDLDDQFYDFQMNIRIPIISQIDEFDFGFSYLVDVADFDSPQEFDINQIIDSTNHKISEVEKLKRSIDKSVNAKKDFMNMMLVFDKIVQRLKTFSNCKSVSVGFIEAISNLITIRLCFNIKDEFYQDFQNLD